MEMDFGLIAQVVTVLLGVLAAVFGKKLSQLKKYGKRTLDLLNYADDCLADGKIDPEEIRGLVKRAKALVNGNPYGQDK